MPLVPSWISPLVQHIFNLPKLTEIMNDSLDANLMPSDLTWLECILFFPSLCLYFFSCLCLLFFSLIFIFIFSPLYWGSMSSLFLNDSPAIKYCTNVHLHQQIIANVLSLRSQIQPVRFIQFQRRASIWPLLLLRRRSISTFFQFLKHESNSNFRRRRRRRRS